MNMLKRTFSLCVCVLLAGATAFPQAPAVQSGKAKTKAQRYVELVAENDILRESVFGVLALNGNGDTLAVLNPETRMLPASNMKLITTGMALQALGPDFKYVTRIGYSGSVSDGVLDGDLYIIGGGDPTIASKDSIAIPRNTLFGEWKSFLDKAGIKTVKGRVIGDGRYFDGPIENDSWSYQDIGTGYGAGGNGLCFYGNAQDVKVTAGAEVGSDVTYNVVFPVTPWISYSCFGKTAKAGTGDELYLYTSDVLPYAEIRGSFAIDRKSRTEEFANKYGAYTCAYYFCDYLRSHGVEVAGGPADVRNGRIRTDVSEASGPYAAKVDDMTVIGSTESPSLKKIARETNHRSDNFYAETLYRTLGRRFHHSASYDSSKVAVNEILSRMNMPASKARIHDGSGLSRKNYVTPSFFTSFLKGMMDSPVFEDYVQTLGQPGGPHYSSRMKNEPESVKSRIHYKSGSMDGVRCFSGYIEPSEGSKSDVIVFSVMTNNATVGASKVDPIIDRIVALLATEN